MLDFTNFENFKICVPNPKKIMTKITTFDQSIVSDIGYTCVNKRCIKGIFFNVISFSF